MAGEPRRKPPAVTRKPTPKPFYLFCQRISYADRKLTTCNAATRKGKPYCEACERQLAEGHHGSKYSSVKTIRSDN